MSPLVFRTDPDSYGDVEIAGVGRLAGAGRGGIPVQRAAESRRMAELLGDDGEPLTGSKLTSAAKAFADARGLVVENVKDLDEEALVVEAGGFPRGPTIEELSAEATARDQAHIPAHDLAMNPYPEAPEAEAPPPRDLPLAAEPATVEAPPVPEDGGPSIPSGEEAR